MAKQSFIDFTYIKENADFEAVLAHYGVKVASRAGAQLRVHCPFHDDQKPSCGVDTAKRRFNCFAGTCGEKGNILEFVAKLESSDLRAAAETLAGICGIPLAPPKSPASAAKPPVERRQGQPAATVPPRRQTASQQAAKRPEEAPDEPVNPALTFELKLDPGHPYLEKRGITAATAKTFGLGYADRGMMKGRLCIPIRNEEGALVAYAGRWVGGDETIPDGEDRYKLPPRFQKNRVLYNLDRNRAAEHLVIVEGYFSVFRLHTVDVGAVALMGSSLSEEQLLLLRRSASAERLTLLLDGDEAGRKARLKILPCLSPFWRVYAPELPDNAQPDTLSEAALCDLLRWPA